MSGIVGIINLDGEPVDKQLLQRMTDSMSFRGPDAQEIWVDNNVSLGHAMFRTTLESESERQPLSLDGRFWLTADARVDGRDELMAKLEAKLGRELTSPVHSNQSSEDSKPRLFLNDAELILYAYQAWGTDCVKHLIGDFAFAIWDVRDRQLFCARDHFGVKPFYYVRKGKHFLFSSSPYPLLLSPETEKALNDQCIADFLLFEMNLDPCTSAFKDIMRLEPASAAVFSGAGLSIQRYWTFEEGEEIRFKKRSSYVEQFEELMLQSVEDRSRSSSTSLLLSGGMDSTTVAAYARAASDGNNGDRQLRAFTYVYDRLMPDRERYYAGVAAQALKIPVDYTVSDNYELYQRPRRDSKAPEIINEPLRALFGDVISAASDHSRVAFTGDGGDALLYAEDDFPRKALQSFSYARLARDIAYCYLSYGRIPRMGFRRNLKSKLSLPTGAKEVFNYPKWLNRDFEERAGIRHRWQEEQNKLAHRSGARRRRTLESLVHPMWPHLFADRDPETTGSRVEFRYPFFDTRVVNFVSRIPSLPWCFDKGLLRIATRKRLPSAITKRAKTAIVSDPILVRVAKPEWRLSECFRPLHRLSEYVDLPKVDKSDWLLDPHSMWMHVRPLSLNSWLEGISLFLEESYESGQRR